MNWENTIELADYVGCSFYEAGRIKKFCHKLAQMALLLEKGTDIIEIPDVEVYDDRSHTGFDLLFREDHGTFKDGQTWNWFHIYFAPYGTPIKTGTLVVDLHYISFEAFRVEHFVKQLPAAYAAVKAMSLVMQADSV